MKIALIIVSICLAIAGCFCFILIKILKHLLDTLIEEQQMEEELAFVEGEIDIPEERIAQKFPNAIMLCHLEKNEFDDSTWKIVDTSSYSKNHIIGLTYFVQPQLFDELKATVSDDAIRDRAKEKVLDAIGDDYEDADMDFLDELIDEAMEELMGDKYDIDEEHGTMTRPLLPHCTVYHLKDGRWLWRQESS